MPSPGGAVQPVIHQCRSRMQKKGGFSAAISNRISSKRLIYASIQRLLFKIPAFDHIRAVQGNKILSICGSYQSLDRICMSCYIPAYIIQWFRTGTSAAQPGAHCSRADSRRFQEITAADLPVSAILPESVDFRFFIFYRITHNTPFWEKTKINTIFILPVCRFSIQSHPDIRLTACNLRYPGQNGNDHSTGVGIS